MMAVCTSNAFSKTGAITRRSAYCHNLEQMGLVLIQVFIFGNLASKASYLFHINGVWGGIIREVFGNGLIPEKVAQT